MEAQYGEAWASPKSWIELGGFACNIAGLVLYCSAPTMPRRAGAAATAARAAMGQRLLHAHDTSSSSTQGGGDGVLCAAAVQEGGE